MKGFILGAIVSFLIGLVLVPITIFFVRRLKANQSILGYVEMHKTKDGTPTMGGLSFLVSVVISAVFLLRENSRLATIVVMCFLFYGLIGFFDDFIKVKFKQNLGLTALQKVIAQLAIAIAFSIYAYNSSLIGPNILVPFINVKMELGIFIVPFVIFTMIAVVNSVNLIDGLDGLCAGVSSVVIVVLAIVTTIGLGMGSGVYAQEIASLNIVLGILLGGVMAFLLFNSHPAKIFMGDTGSLAIGGLIASFLVVTKQELLILFVGIMYVLTAMSVVLQVLSYKLTKKRVFKMAPLHHHFEMTYGENKVVATYVIVSIVVGAIVIFLYL
ncbi:MAG: phospho-N-acetylmuramoyl-pentapeptide-transferase [Clostridia bacterium]|nr:phospho-N-acetylmuramoyl-pentapeptide-transferase [Clostridia bacterium]